MKIDPTKKYQTRDGRPVTLLHRAPEGWPSPFPWRGAIGDNGTATWNDSGKHIDSSVDATLDLIEVREPLEISVLITANGTPTGLGENTVGMNHAYPTLAPFRIAKFREVIP